MYSVYVISARMWVYPDLVATEAKPSSSKNPLSINLSLDSCSYPTKIHGCVLVTVLSEADIEYIWILTSSIFWVRLSRKYTCKLYMCLVMESKDWFTKTSSNYSFAHFTTISNHFLNSHIWILSQKWGSNRPFEVFFMHKSFFFSKATT